MATFVLIPGAGGHAAYWNRLVPELESRGHRAIAVDERAVVHDVSWGSRFRIHHGVADRFVAGRVALAGGAAHDNSPPQSLVATLLITTGSF